MVWACKNNVEAKGTKKGIKIQIKRRDLWDKTGQEGAATYWKITREERAGLIGKDCWKKDETAVFSSTSLYQMQMMLVKEVAENT
jgi:hypothetical protein